MILYDVATELAEMGQDVTVYATNANADVDLPTEYIGPREIEGVKVHYFPRSRHPAILRRYVSMTFYRHLRDHIHYFDIVHIWHIFTFMAVATALLARRAKKRYIVSPQANLSPVAFRKNHLAKTLYLRFIESLTFNAAAGVQCNTAFDAAWAVGCGIKKSNLLPVVTYGIRDLPEYVEPTPKKRSRYFLFIGRMDKIKGLDFFLDVLALLIIRDGVDCRFVGIGHKSTGYDRIFEGLVQAKGLTKYVEWKGFASDELKRQLVDQAACVILPSYTESFGLVIVEAMAMGAPVVISDQCNVREHVEKACCGFVIPHDPEMWATRLKELLDNPGLGDEFGQRGWRYFKRNLTVTHCANGLLKNYERLVDGEPLIALGEARQQHTDDRSVVR